MHSDSRNALGALFGALSALMMSIIGLLKTADKAVEMLDVATTDAKVRQAVRSKVDRSVYAKRYVRDAAMKEHEADQRIQEYTDRSPQHKAEFQAIYNRLMAAANMAHEDPEISVEPDQLHVA